ncbi:hypothetical protein ACHAXT_011244 [Thalassiosira profunda]
MRPGASVAAGVACAVGLTVTVMKRDAIIGLASSGISQTNGGAESHAARFARGAPIVPAGDDNRRKLGATGALKERTLTSFPRDTQDAHEDSGKRMLQTGAKRASRKNGDTEAEGTEGMQMTAARNRGESIAEAFAQNDLQFRPAGNPGQMKAQTSESDANASGFPHKYLAIRYVPWAQLSETTRSMMADDFGYNEEEWNTLESNDVEGSTFSQLTQGQKDGLSMMGINGDVWDCFVNHYSSYHRTDLQDLGIYEGAVELWNVRSEKDWDELSEKEVVWATRLCYTEEVWNGLTLGTW